MHQKMVILQEDTAQVNIICFRYCYAHNYFWAAADLLVSQNEKTAMILINQVEKAAMRFGMRHAIAVRQGRRKSSKGALNSKAGK